MHTINAPESLSFDDVLLVPRYSEICSRKEIDTSVNIGNGVILGVPIISSPMDTVTESSMAASMSFLGGVGIIHRYNSPSEQAQLVADAYGSVKRDHIQNIGFAVGVGEDMLTRAKKCLKAGANFICIDIAHGHHSLMRHALKVLRNTLGTDIHIMAGNVATLEGFNDLADWGADSIRVGIGGGSICSTRVQTGHGVPTLQSVIDCSRSDRDAGLIADGGIKNSGDIVKCLAAGADAVMVGSLLAGADESPGEKVEVDGNLVKVYRGMASKDAQVKWRGHYSSIEGVSSHVKCSGPISKIIRELETGIRSGMSYSGCSNILEFSAKSKFIRQSHAGTIESSTHIKNR